MPLTLFFQLTIYLLFFVNNHKFFSDFLFLLNVIDKNFFKTLLIIVIFPYAHVGYCYAFLILSISFIFGFIIFIIEIVH